MTQAGWQYNTQSLGDVALLQSLGYVVGCTPEALVLTTSIGSRGGMLDPLSIPWKCIVQLDYVGSEWDR